MSKEAREFANEIKKTVKIVLQSFLVTVKSVNQDNYTCVVETNDIQYGDVRLRAVIDSNLNGFIVIPTVNSKVLVSRIGNSNELFVSMFSEIDKVKILKGNLSLLFDSVNGEIVLNDGAKNSYLSDINAVVSKLNTIENSINTLKQVFSSWVPAPGDGGAALKTASATWAGQSLTQTTVNDLKDEKVRH